MLNFRTELRNIVSPPQIDYYLFTSKIRLIIRIIIMMMIITNINWRRARPTNWTHELILHYDDEFLRIIFSRQTDYYDSTGIRGIDWKRKTTKVEARKWQTSYWKKSRRSNQIINTDESEILIFPTSEAAVLIIRGTLSRLHVIFFSSSLLWNGKVTKNKKTSQLVFLLPVII